MFSQTPSRAFATKNDDGSDPSKPDTAKKEKKTTRAQKASEAEIEDGAEEVKPKRKRRTKAEMEADRAAKSLKEKMKPVIAQKAGAPIVHGPEVIVEVDE